VNYSVFEVIFGYLTIEESH
jgi:hypothetical protein